MQPTKFQVKLYAGADDVDLETLIPVFHEWIRLKKIDDELLIDVADYAHVPQGPGVVLIGHQSDYYLDLADDRPGLLYSRKRGFEGDLETGIADAFGRALRACQLLEEEDRLDLRFRTDEAVFRIQDRLAAPNDGSTLAALRPALESVTQTLFGEGVTFEQVGAPRDPFTLRLGTGEDVGVSAVLSRL